MKAKRLAITALTVWVFILACSLSAFATEAVEYSILKTLQLDETPIDMALTVDGRRIFVLTQEGNILVYSSAAGLEAKIAVGKHVDQIKLAPKEDVLILRSAQSKTVQIASLDFIQDINIAGSPYKGAQNAPVVIAVFSDFQ